MSHREALENVFIRRQGLHDLGNYTPTNEDQQTHDEGKAELGQRLPPIQNGKVMNLPPLGRID